MSLTRIQVQRATTVSPWTRDFRHLLPVPKHFQNRQTWFDPITKAVRVKDRIKYWNVVPGDQISIRGDTRKTIHEVLSINKFTNRVYLKGANLHEGKPYKTPVNRSVHYSRCMLYIGEHVRKATSPGEQPKAISVFARRIGVRDPHWDPILYRWNWKRLVLATDPYTPKTKIELEWPQPEERDHQEPNPLLDTAPETVREITYKPPVFSLSNLISLQSGATEKVYLRTLFNPSAVPFDTSAPMEVHLTKELSNPHSRAKKQARWQAAVKRKSTLFKKFIAQELKNINGRSIRDARAEAAFKYRQKLEKERKSEKKRRWLTKDRLAKMERKSTRKARKAEKQKEKLSQLVLRDAPNQFIPGKSARRQEA
ncbi:hypothetical protein EV702DRAFT_1082072 [Suillus placidus]|uniref:Uncharacterized protein n=1 Tax=Suillus placidus TaxID=48579 RepID=A0A9P7D4U1_9AGAM|nr:hypothetical protein EV702DRAFT_1082072 [Suillus placidus]